MGVKQPFGLASKENDRENHQFGRFPEQTQMPTPGVRLPVHHTRPGFFLAPRRAPLAAAVARGMAPRTTW